MLVAVFALWYAEAIGARFDPDEAVNIRVYSEVRNSVANITNVVVDYDIFFTPYASASSGSGVIIDRAGHIVTNHHVVDGAAKLEVTLADESKWPAEVVGKDPATDLALLRITAPESRLHPIRFGDSTDLKVGQKVLAIGNPFGLEQSLTIGIVSSIRRYLKLGSVEMDNVIQTDAAINPGNSGGPLLDSAGRLVGINTAIFSPSGGNVGVGFAVPAETVTRVIVELKDKGYVAYAWMGIEMQTLIPRYAEALDVPAQRGVLVGRLLRGSPADRAGLRGGSEQVIIGNTRLVVGGDTIVEADGRPVSSSDDLQRILRRKTPGEVLRITVIRNGARQSLAVTLAARPRE
ncbi:MAG: trypsin-like peptidase domain-containing protein [Nitrospiria bacterium]